MARELAEPWVLEAVLEASGKKCVLDETELQGFAQVLQLHRNPANPEDVNCVLSDKRHTIGAVLTAQSIEDFRDETPMYTVDHLEGTVVIILDYLVTRNTKTRQFTLRVLEFKWVGAQGNPVHGSPVCVMEAEEAKRAWEVVERSAASSVNASSANASSANASSANASSANASSANASSAGSSNCPPPRRERYLDRFRYQLPLECAANPVRAEYPHRLMHEFLTVPKDQLEIVRKMLGDDAHLLLVGDEEEEAPEEISEEMCEEEEMREEETPEEETPAQVGDDGAAGGDVAAGDAGDGAAAAAARDGEAGGEVAAAAVGEADADEETQLEIETEEHTEAELTEEELTEEELAEGATQVETQAEGRAEVEAQAETQIELEGEAETQIELEGEADTQIELEGEAETQKELKGEDLTDIEPEPRPDAELQPRPRGESSQLKRGRQAQNQSTFAIIEFEY